MRVHIREKDGAILRIPIPVSLLLNELTAPLAFVFLKPYLKKHRVSLTFSQLCRLLRALRKAKRCLNGTPLADISEKDGDHIIVWL